jgi:hypothetical protein
LIGKEITIQALPPLPGGGPERIAQSKGRSSKKKK